MGRFIKLVIIGTSGVGKTSLRAQYISGRFATGYRATIGTDFITKTVPHHSDPAQESVTLQIWDTAGQERFSSLSTAFFRGADAVILVFDVNKPETLIGLRRWWDEFRDRVPIADGDEAKYCVVVVGNKCDMLPSSRRSSKETARTREATTFLRNLIPLPEDLVDQADSPVSQQELSVDGVDLSSEPPSPIASVPPASSLSSSRPAILPTIYSNPSISGLASELPKSPAGSQSTPRLSQLNFNRQSRYPTSGTMTSTRTSMSIYHTPSSSLFESPLPERTRSDSPIEDSPPVVEDPSSSRSLPIQSTSHPLQSNRRADDEFDLEHEYDFDYATAKSTPTHSPSPSPYGSRRRPNPKARPRLFSTSSEASLLTIKPDFRDHPTQILVPDSALTDDASDTADSSSTKSTDQSRGIHPIDLLTPSASPPSPPKLTASLLASLSQNPDIPSSSSLRESNLDVGPKLFFTSAKTGGVPQVSAKTAVIDGVKITPVSEIFEYVAKRVVERWEWEERMMEFADNNDSDGLSIGGIGANSGGNSIVRLGEKWREWVGGPRRSCCA